MLLLSPSWLILLAPWTVLAIWLMRGRFETRSVPFLELWPREAMQNQRVDRAWRFPPPAIVAMLAGMLLAICAAAQPEIKGRPIATVTPSVVRIESLAVRSIPTTQAMVEVLNDSDQTSAKLIVHTDGVDITRQVDLPGRGERKNYFIDLPSISSNSVEAEVSESHARVVRSGSWPVIDAPDPLPPELGRMIEVYARHRIPGEGSKHIAVVTASENVPNEPAAVVLNEQSGGHQVGGGPRTVEDHPLTRSVDWDRVLASATIQSPEGDDWQSVVFARNDVPVAVREKPFRQVWVGFVSEDFPRTPDFVIFWTNVFDWLGDGGEEYEAVTEPSPAVATATGSEDQKLVSLAAPALLISLGMMVLSALLWKAPKVTHAKNFIS
jgi:hypothetical protein